VEGAVVGHHPEESAEDPPDGVVFGAGEDVGVQLDGGGRHFDTPMFSAERRRARA
jgi:hypothetical protein